MSLVQSFQKRVHLERLNKGVEENSDADTSPKQFDQPSRTEQFEEADLDQLGHVDDTSHHCDEVKDVPRLPEVVLRENVSNSITILHQLKTQPCCASFVHYDNFWSSLSFPPNYLERNTSIGIASLMKREF